eukprot:UN15403
MPLIINKNEIRILSLNLWNYNHFALRIGMLVDLIKTYRPHIIGFQEVRSKLLTMDNYFQKKKFHYRSN